MENSGQTDKGTNMPKTVVLRWGHRPQRDSRLTAHVALTARALGATGMILSDVNDPRILETIEKVTENWGGRFFLEMGTPWRKVVKGWKTNGGMIVHLTAYGENLTSRLIRRISESERDILVIVGCQKVPKEFFSEDVSDFNVAIGNQPHSECSSLAIFLDRLSQGKALESSFENAKIRIVPQKRGKKIAERRRS